MPKSNYISSKKFRELEIDEKVIIRFMLGDAIVASKPNIDLDNSEEHKRETIDIRFDSGPWKGRILNLIRQQISNTSRSFPPRKEYK